MTPLNDTLVANDITVVVEEDVSGYEISLSATDAENSTLTFSIVDSPLYGEVDTTTLGAVSYTHLTLPTSSGV